MRYFSCVAVVAALLAGCGEADTQPIKVGSSPRVREKRLDSPERFRSLDDGMRIEVELGQVLSVMFPDLDETIPDLKVPEFGRWTIENVVVRKVDPAGCVIVASGKDGLETRYAWFGYIEAKGWTWGPIHLGEEGRAGMWKPLDARVGGDRLTVTFGRVDGLSVSLRLYEHDCMSRFALDAKDGDIGKLFRIASQGGTLIEIPRSDLDPG